MYVVELSLAASGNCDRCWIELAALEALELSFAEMDVDGDIDCTIFVFKTSGSEKSGSLWFRGLRPRLLSRARYSLGTLSNESLHALRTSGMTSLYSNAAWLEPRWVPCAVLANKIALLDRLMRSLFVPFVASLSPNCHLSILYGTPSAEPRGVVDCSKSTY